MNGPRSLPLIFAVMLFAGRSNSQSSPAPGKSAGAEVKTGTITCENPLVGKPQTVQTYARDCTRDSDCEIGLHMTSCGGGQTAFGVRKDEAARFRSPGGVCGDARYEEHTCGILNFGVMDEEGHRSTQGAKAFRAFCKAGVCVSRCVGGRKTCSSAAH